MKQKGFSIIFIAIIVGAVILVSVGGYFAYAQIKSHQTERVDKEKQAQELIKLQQEALEKAKQEIESLKKEQAKEVPTKTNYSSQTKIDPSIKIEKCKTEATFLADQEAKGEYLQASQDATTRGDSESAYMFLQAIANSTHPADWDSNYQLNYIECLNR